MKVVPMIFNTEMVKAIINGRKTVTRRPMKPQPTDSGSGYMWWPSKVFETMINIEKTKEGQFWDELVGDMCPLASIGDLVWIRETFSALGHDDFQQVSPMCLTEIHEYRYKASEPVGLANCSDHEVRGYKWVPSIHMPRSASRLTLKVTDVRIEQIQDISEDQAQCEGFRYNSLYNEWGGLEAHPDSRSHAPQWGWYEKATHAFKSLWNSIYNNWDQNPYVWVVEFEVIHKNVDKVLAEVACD
ncbi:hypothetical protein [Vibrio hepatarius]|uniref:hypothetical protein n=1 Tax=Vibrio hepatarius TaxID=171383 RepID=UPI001C09969A|nr:hypothetical protein [Vibrio hepatarius]MBU2897707.1 hypothetical protein [Vibrio hepatarius]